MQFSTKGECQVDLVQIEDDVFPLLLTFAEGASSLDTAGSTEQYFAAISPQLQTAADLVHELTLLAVNLLSQLGALCSEQTRKSTVISGSCHLLSLQPAALLPCPWLQ